jgi:uncharacterized protein YlaI
MSTSKTTAQNERITTAHNRTRTTAQNRNKNIRIPMKQQHPHRIWIRTSAPHQNNNKPHRIDTRTSAQQTSIARMGIRGSVSPWGARRRHKKESRIAGGRGSRSGPQRTLGQRRHRGRRTAPPGVPARKWGASASRSRSGAGERRGSPTVADWSSPHTVTKL